MMPETKTLHIRNPEETNLCSGLYIVPTPIGNLRDMTLRALDVLSAADIIVCEDSRVTGKLLKAYDIKVAKKIVYNDHADDETKAHIIQLIKNGKTVALVSDAGTPLISDPGYKLVRDCLQNDCYVTALPGANAVLPAIQLSGLPSDRFIFAGFLPTKSKAVKEMLNYYARSAETLVFYESPNRIEKTLQMIAEVMPHRQCAIIREISKLYESGLYGTAQDLLDQISDKPIKGEMALLIEGQDKLEENMTAEDIDMLITKAIGKGQSIKDLSQEIAGVTGKKKKEIYNRALDLQNTL